MSNLIDSSLDSIICLSDVQRFITTHNVNAIVNNVTKGIIPVDFKFCDGDTMLHMAIKLGRKRIISLLLNVLNASVTIKNALGRTAFFCACAEGMFFEVSQILIIKSNIHSYINIPDFSGITPLFYVHTYLSTSYLSISTISAISDILQQNGAVLDTSPTIYSPFSRRSTSPLPFSNRYSISNRNISRVELNPNITVRNKNKSTKQTNKTQTHLKNEYIDMLVELKRTCNICFEPYEKDKVIIFDKCQHTVCLNCFPKLKICHMCRQEI
jgi:ankyrin repeat protein